MLAAPASDCDTWLGGYAANMPGAGVDGADEVKDGHDGLTGTRKAPIASRARTEVEGTCCLVVDGSNAREVFIDGLMGTLTMMVSPVENMADLVSIRGGQGG